MEFKRFGGICLISCTSIRDEFEGIEKFINIVIDITEEKRMEDQLLGSEQKYRIIFKDAVLSIYRTTPN